MLIHADLNGRVSHPARGQTSVWRSAAIFTSAISQIFNNFNLQRSCTLMRAGQVRTSCRLQVGDTARYSRVKLSVTRKPNMALVGAKGVAVVSVHEVLEPKARPAHVQSNCHLLRHDEHRDRTAKGNNL